jgi:hypothetical protein
MVTISPAIRARRPRQASGRVSGGLQSVPSFGLHYAEVMRSPGAQVMPRTNASDSPPAATDNASRDRLARRLRRVRC